jgi:restriction system protein
MPKRKESGIEFVATLVWPAGIVLGFLAFIGIQYGLNWIWRSSDNPFLSGLGKVAATGMLAPFAWLILVAFCAASAASFFSRRKRRQLLDAQTGMDSLRSMDWRTFELLVGEAFRQQGYAAEETGQGGADGGVDLVLRKNGQKILVQCKQWRAQRVGVQVVREMFGILVDQGAAAVKIVALGGYTPDAAAFARNKPIELIDGRTLLSTVTRLQAKKEPDGPLDTPLLFAGSLAACLLIAFALPNRQSQPSSPSTGRSISSVDEAKAPATFLPTASMAHPIPAPVATQPTKKIYKASAPMSSEELRDWEKRNREAMKIMEKTTPELEAPPPH